MTGILNFGVQSYALVLLDVRMGITVMHLNGKISICKHSQLSLQTCHFSWDAYALCQGKAQWQLRAQDVSC